MAESNVSEPVFRFGEFNADLRARELHRGETLVPLQDQPFRILAALLVRDGVLVTRNELRVLLWSDDTFVDFDHGLNTAIRKLREALGDCASSPRFIETLPKRGYRFIAPAKRLSVRRDDLAIAPRPAIERAPQLASGGRRVRAALFIGAALAAAAAMELARAQWRTVSRRVVHSDVNPPSREAYDLYLRGKARLRQESDADVSAAIQLLERAADLAPDYAPAHAELSHAYGLRVAQFAPDDTVALERAKLAADKALRLDPDLGESHYAAGQLLWGVVENRFMAERAIRELELAVSLNPRLSEAHHHLGQIYLHVGLLDQAVAALEHALELQPGDDNAIRRLGLVSMYRGRYEEALTAFRQAAPQSNSALWHYQVSSVLLYLGRDGDAGSLIDDYLRRHPEDRGGVVTSTRAIGFARIGDSARTEADIASAIAKGKGFIHFHHTAYNIASAYALLRRPRAALPWLRTTAESGLPCYPYFANDPNLESLRGDPEFERFMADLQVTWQRYRALP